MKRLSRLLPLVLAGFVFILAAKEAPGQGNNAPKGKTKVVNANVSGTVTAIQGDTVLMTNSSNEKWIVQVNSPSFGFRAKVTVEGEAVVGALRPGVYVRFTADVDQRGNVQGDLTELVIFSPSESAKPGMYSNDGAGDTGEGDKADVSNYLVLGQVASYRKGKLTLAIPGSKGVRGSVSEDVKVTVRGEDYRMARPGDKIFAKGFHLPDQKGTLMAHEITITLSGVLGETAKSKKERDRLAKRDADKKPAQPRPGFDDKSGPPADKDADDDNGPLILIIN